MMTETALIPGVASFNKLNPNSELYELKTSCSRLIDRFSIGKGMERESLRKHYTLAKRLECP